MTNLTLALKQIEQLPRKKDGYISFAALPPLVKQYKGQNELALKLWATQNHAAQHVALRIIQPDFITEEILNAWVSDLGDWVITDAFAAHLVRATPIASKMIYQWVDDPREFVRRTAFATIAQMVGKKHQRSDQFFIDFMPMIEKYASDDRFYVKKSINWALRAFAKRNETLCANILELRERLLQQDNKTAHWIANHRAHEYFKNSRSKA